MSHEKVGYLVKYANLLVKKLLEFSVNFLSKTCIYCKNTIK